MRALHPAIVSLALLIAFGPAPARAALSCSTTGASTIAFGTVASVSASNVDVSQTQTITCSYLNSDLPGANGSSHTLNVCVSYDNGTGGPSVGGNRRVTSGINAANYDIYTTNAFSGTHWGMRIGAPVGTVKLVPLTFVKVNNGNTTVTASGSLPLFARLFGSQSTVPNGAYSSTLTQTAEAFLDTNATCSVVGVAAGSFTTTQQVTATYDASCRIGTIADLDFGTQGFLTSTTDATTTAAVTCPVALVYTLSLSAGTSAGATASSRKLTRSGVPATTVNYGLYRDANRTMNWGNTANVDTQAGVGTGSAQSYTIYGRVPAQSTPEPGSYTDTLVLTVTF